MKEQLLAKRILLRLISDDDSFVYLNAMHAIGRLIDINRKALFPLFLTIFEANESLSVEDRLCVRDRAALGEALTFSIRRAGEVAPLYVPDVVRVCVAICRRRIDLCKVREDVDLDRRRVLVRNQETAEVSESIAAEAAAKADEVFLRQAAFSLLAEAMATAGWSASKYMREVIDVAKGPLYMEDMRHQESIAVRR